MKLVSAVRSGASRPGSAVSRVGISGLLRKNMAGSLEAASGETYIVVSRAAFTCACGAARKAIFGAP